jgi:signal recognition particle subunit SRP54
MADRILGMGDVLTLIEQAERTFDQGVAEKAASAMIEGRFTLEDFLEQLQQVKKMGSFSGMLSMLPGVPKDLKQASSAIDDGQIAQVEAIIRSMTPAERVDPATIDGSRRLRIANGSGTATADVNALLKQFKEMQKMMKGMGKGGMGGALGGLLGRGGKMPPGGMAGLEDMAGSMGGLGGMGAPGGLGQAGAPAALGAGGFAGAGAGAGSSGGGGARSSSKGKGGKGKKGKGGGRVTPKSR